MTRTESVLLWFRSDLRLADSPALHAAVSTGLPVIPVFIWSPEEDDPPPGAASRWWLHQSLTALDRSLREKNSRIIVRQGPATEALLNLAEECNVRRIFCHR